MKYGFCKASRCCGYTFRRFRTASLISVISLCFVLFHYLMKDHWTERLLHSGRRNMNSRLSMISSSTSIYPGQKFSAKLAGTTRLPLPLSISRASTRRYEFSKKTHSPPYTQTDDIWLTEFTAGLPRNLVKILQNILTRDFEKSNATLSRSVARCQKGYFRLNGMGNCRKWLGCSEVNFLEKGSTVGTGVGKIVSSFLFLFGCMIELIDATHEISLTRYRIIYI